MKIRLSYLAVTVFFLLLSLRGAGQCTVVVTTANTAAICSGTSTNISLTASVASTFTWTIGTITGSITGASDGSGSIINQTLTNPSNTISGTVAYIVTPTSITDPCQGADYTISVTVNPKPAVTTANTATICSGTGPNISLTASVASTFAWTVGTITGGITGASAGSGATINQTLTNPSSATAGTVAYLVTPTATTGPCQGAAYTITVTVNPAPVVTTANPAAICSGTSPNISLTASVASTFAWTVGTITGGITGASAGSGSTINQTLTNPSSATAGTIAYLVTPTSTNSCAGAAYTITVTVNPAPVVTTANPAAICSGTSPNINLTASATSTFTWILGTITGGITGASAGSGATINQTLTNPSSATAGTVAYLVTPTATTGPCQGAAYTITVTVNPAPVVTTANPAAICSGTSPNISLTASAASTFAWTVGTITGSITGASDGSGSIINQTLTNPSNATSGTVAYLVTPTATTGSCAGAAYTISVTVNPKPAVTTASTATICSGTGPNISLTASATSTFAWTVGTITGGITGASTSSGATINQILTNPSSATAGTVAYIVTPTSTTGSCAGAAYTITVTVNPTTVVTTVSTAAICSGTGPNISLTASATSTFTWILGTITGGITGASAGSGTNINQTLTNPSSATAGTVAYLVTPTATTGPCQGAAYTITVTVNPTPIVTNSATASTCSGTGPNISLTASATSTFTWILGTITGSITGASAGSGSTINQTLTNPSSATSGTVAYLITPTSTNSCAGAAYTITVTVNPAPDVTTASTATICSGTGPNISLTASLPGSFTWTIGTITGGITGASAASGLTINQTLTNPSNTTAGTVAYLVTPTSTTGSCAGAAYTITVTVNPTPTITNSATASTCSGTSPNITLTPSAPSNFAWTIGTITGGITGASAGSGANINQILTNPSNTTAGTVAYLVTPTSTTGSCAGAAYTITVTVNPTPIVTNSATASTCSGTGPNIRLTASAVSTFTWTVGTITGSIAGASASSGANINQTLTNPSITTSGTVAYLVTPTSTNSCAGAAYTITVTVNPAPDVTTPSTATICSGTSPNISLTASVSSTFTWTVGTITGGITGASAGSGLTINQTLTNPSNTTSGTVAYLVTPNATVGSCAAYTITVTVNPTPTVTNSPTASTCSGTSPNISLTASVPSNFAWTIGTITGGITGASAGSGATINQTLTNPSSATAGTVAYLVTPTSTTGPCQGAAYTITVTVNPAPVVTTANPAAICSGTGPNISLTASAASTFTWTVGTITGSITGASAGSGSTINQTLTNPSNTTSGTVAYLVTPTSTNLCAGAAYTITVTVNPAPPTPVVTLSGSTTFCTGGSVTLTAPVGYSYQWSNGATAQSIVVSSAGSFSVVVTDLVSGCSSVPSNTIVVTVVQMPYVNAGTEDFVCITGIYTVQDASITNSYASFVWSIATGAGTLLNPNSLTPTYMPDAADLGTQVTLLLTANAMAPCTGTSSNVKLLTVTNNPIADAGTNAIICETATYQITGASATNWSRLSWTTNGTGTFINTESISPTYVPSTADIATGSVILTLEATNPPCLSDFDQMELTFRRLPDVYAGYDATVDIGSFFHITTASVANDSLFVWSTSGTGTFDDFNIINPVYTPSNQDFAWGSVRLILTAKGVAPCNGETISDYMILTVTNYPPVDFTWDISCPGWPVQFNIDDTVTDIGAIASYNWNFGDGTTSSLMEPPHTYGVPGFYNVTLTVVDTANYSNTVQKSVEVYELPVASFSYDAPGCEGEPTAFINHSSGTAGYITKWLWDFGDGNSTTVIFPVNPNVTHTYLLSGTYSAILTVTSSTGCVATDVQTITINPAPIAAFEYSGNCTENNVQFTDLSQPGGGGQIVNWLWNFGDPASGVNNTSNLQSPAHIFNIAGTHNVTLTTTNVNNCSGTISKPITVGAGPDVEFIITSGTCVGSDVSFEPDPAVMDPASIASYLWNFGDGISSTSPESTHVYNVAGTFQVTLTVVFNNGCTNSVSRPVTIGAPPVAAFSYISACIDNATKFTDYSYTGSGEPIVSWLWKFNETNVADTSNLQYPVFKYTAQGTYNVTLKVTTLSGCPDTITIPVQVLPAPKANFNFIANTCADGNVSFQDSSISTISAITEWKWEFEPGYISTLKNPNHSFSYTDRCDTVKLTVTDMRGCVNTKAKEVCVPAGLEVDIDHSPACFGDSILFGPLAPAGDSLIAFQWNFGDLASGSYNTSNLRKPFHYFKTQGSYSVSLTATDTNNCSKTVYHQVDIQELQTPVFSYTQDNCDYTVNFNASPTGVGFGTKTWIWNFGDGESDSINVPRNGDTLHIYTSPGIYYVTMTVINRSGCSASFSDSLLVKPCLDAIFTQVDTLGCQNQAITFADSSSSGVPITEWFWDFGDGNDSTYNAYQPDMTHIFDTSGTFKVKLVISAQIDGVTVFNSVTHQVTINPSPIAGYITKNIAGDTTKGVCLGLPAKFINTSSGNGSQISSFAWDFGDPGTSIDSSSVNNPTYTYKQSGAFNVALIAMNPFGCSDTITSKLTIHPLPIADFQFSNSCAGDTTYFMDVSDTMNITLKNWEWSFMDTLLIIGHDTRQYPGYLFATKGNHQARLIITDINGCQDDTLKPVVTYPVTISAFEIKEDYDNIQGRIHLINKTLNATGYEWDFGNGFTSTDKEPTITYDIEGPYKIKLISYIYPQCADTLMKDYILLFKGLYVPNAFSPTNPMDGVRLFKPVGINIKEGTYLVEVYDSWGKLIWSSTKLDLNGSPEEGWDGTAPNGNLLPQDVYVWRISAVFRDGTVWNSKNAGDHTNIPEKTYGTVTLLR